jgi:UPF0271 protein
VRRIDLNADLGEGSSKDGELLALVSSANIACGLHAGDPCTITTALRAAAKAGVAVGAHPSLADRECFGRRELPVTPDQVFSLVTYQVAAFAALANAVGVTPRHVKPHGALYNMAARDRSLADAVANAVSGFDQKLFLVAPPESELMQAGRAAGLRVVAEFFADRNYMPDGSLAPRSRADALLHDYSEAARRVIRMLRENVVAAVDGSSVPMHAETVCLHGDNAGAVLFAKCVREELDRAGVEVGPVSD